MNLVPLERGIHLKDLVAAGGHRLGWRHESLRFEAARRQAAELSISCSSSC